MASDRASTRQMLCIQENAELLWNELVDEIKYMLKEFPDEKKRWLRAVSAPYLAIVLIVKTELDSEGDHIVKAADSLLDIIHDLFDIIGPDSILRHFSDPDLYYYDDHDFSLIEDPGLCVYMKMIRRICGRLFLDSTAASAACYHANDLFGPDIASKIVQDLGL